MTTTYSRNMNSKPKADTSQRAKRKCLMCGNDFMSRDRGNRRCKRCESQMGLAEHAGCDVETYRVLR